MADNNQCPNCTQGVLVNGTCNLCGFTAKKEAAKPKEGKK